MLFDLAGDGIVYSSSVGFPEFALASSNNGTKLVSIATPSGYSAIVWPKDLVGYYLALSSDTYVNKFLILSYSSANTILVSDPSNLLPTLSDLQWQISGVKKEQRPTLTSIDIHFNLLGDENENYPGATSNTGPGNAGGNPR